MRVIFRAALAVLTLATGGCPLPPTSDQCNARDYTAAQRESCYRKSIESRLEGTGLDPNYYYRHPEADPFRDEYYPYPQPKP